jgi:hypothetical protein
MSDLAEFARLWREAGYLPPEGTPVRPAEPFDAAAYVRQQRLARFKEHCPVEFQQKIDLAKVENLVAWNEADAWQGSHPGLWLWSYGTGKAKSRMLWRKFGHLHVRQAKTVLRVTGFNLAEEYHDKLNSNRTFAFYQRLQAVDVVMLDDLDKMKLPEETDGFHEKEVSARNARMLREVFDRFYEQHTPVLVTSNEPIAWFEERIGPSGGRRMREVCKEIDFSEPRLPGL